MGKSSKKSKHINIGNDFKKQKLKAGKKKPSANATLTTFKSKSIYICEQLKAQSENEILSYSKHSLPELFSHLNHYSANFRFRAMVGIKEIVVRKNSEATDINPGTIIQKTSKFMMDDDFDVRKACISLLSFLFDELPEKKMSPHFPLVLSHLYCAMSHISVSVQKDSLKVVEISMRYYPNLIRHYAGTKLLQYFLELISVKESGINSTGRVLATTLALKKETAIQWRVRVLSQILSLLKILYRPITTVLKEDWNQVHFWKTENLSIKLLPTLSKQRGISLNNIQQQNVAASAGPSTQKLMEITFPILLQCWMEVSASSVLEKDVETVQTMINVLSITQLFCAEIGRELENNPSKANWLRKQYFPLFAKHFFNNFPFEPPEETNKCESEAKRRKATTETVKRSDYEYINLLACDLCSLLTANSYLDEDRQRIEETFEYLADFLESAAAASFVDTQLMELVLSSIKRLLSFQNVQDYGDAVVSSLYKYCCSAKCSRVSRAKIMRIMMELYETSSTLREYSCFEKLLLDLPSNFWSKLQDFSTRPSDSCKFKQMDMSLEHLNSLLKCMQCAFRRKDVYFLNGVLKFFNKIVTTVEKNNERMFCTSMVNCIKCVQFQNSVFGCLLPLLPSISENDFMVLSKFCCNSLVQLQSRTFVVDILMLKVLPNDELFYTPLSKSEVGHFLKFLFTILVKTEKEANLANAMLQHEAMCNCVCSSMLQLSEFWPQLWQVQNAFLEKKLKVASTSVKSQSILGLLKLGCSLAKQDHFEMDLNGIGRFLAAFSMLCAKQSREWEDCVRCCIVNLLSYSKIMNSFIRVLIKTDSPISVVALTNLLEVAELQDSYKAFASDITSYVAQSEKSTNADDFRKLKSLSSAMLAVL